MKFDHFDRTIFGAIGILVLLVGGVVLRGDQVGVPIESFSPADGASPSTTAAIRITFGQPMNEEQTAEQFSISPNVEGTIVWDGNTLIFEPETPYPVGETLSISLLAGAESEDGHTQTLRDFEWSFTPRSAAILYLGPPDVQLKSLWSIPIEGGEPEQVYVNDFGVIDFDVSADGEQIAMTLGTQEGTGDIWIINRDGSQAKQITDCSPGICSMPSWRPNGKQIAYERRDPTEQGDIGPSRIWFYDFDTQVSQIVFEDTQVLGFGAQWSPDGNKLAFFDSNVREIRVLDVNEGGTFRIPSEMGEVGSFGPNGELMVYTDIRIVGAQFFNELYEADLKQGGGLARVFDEAEEDRWPAVSPDGKWLVFGRRRLDRSDGFATQMMLYDIVNEELIQITDDPIINNLLFSWDSSGRYIIFTQFNLEESYAQPQVWIYDMETGEMRFLVEGATSAQWAP